MESINGMQPLTLMFQVTEMSTFTPFMGQSRAMAQIAIPKEPLTEPISNDERYVLDINAPTMIPRERVSFSKRWEWKPRGTDNMLDLGQVSLSDKIVNLRRSSGAMMDSEIHVIYLPHIPVENYRHHNVIFTLNFEGTSEEEYKLLSNAEFPLPLHTHIIFYPGHSFSLKRGGSYPWSISMSTDADFRDDYVLADIFVQYRAYNTPTSQYSEKRGANIISLVPMSEIPTGIALTRPRNGGDLKVIGLQYGLRHGKDIKILQQMQESGVDIEALQGLGLLSEAVKVVGKVLGGTNEHLTEPINQQICRATLAVLQKKKSKF